MRADGTHMMLDDGRVVPFVYMDPEFRERAPQAYDVSVDDMCQVTQYKYDAIARFGEYHSYFRYLVRAALYLSFSDLRTIVRKVDELNRARGRNPDGNASAPRVIDE